MKFSCIHRILSDMKQAMKPESNLQLPLSFAPISKKKIRTAGLYDHPLAIRTVESRICLSQNLKPLATNVAKLLRQKKELRGHEVATDILRLFFRLQEIHCDWASNSGP